MMKLLLKTAGCAAIGLGLMAASVQPAPAQVRGDKAVYFTFSAPVTLPQVTLPAGKYLFRLADSLVNRTIVQIYSADGSKMHAMMMTLPSQRTQAPDEPEIRFLETAANTPPAIATFWYPGERTGWEFVYPRQQALELARAAKQPVLTTAQNAATADEMRTAELARVSPTGEQVALDATAPEPPATANARVQRGEVANDAPTPAGQQSAAANQTRQGGAANQTPQGAAANQTRPTAAANQEPRTQLPATGSTMPLFLLAGALALAAAVGLGWWRRPARS